MSTLLSIIGGAIIAISVAVLVEYLRKPRLVMRIVQPRDANYDGGPAHVARFLDVEVLNKPLPWCARWMSRAPALQCHGFVTFHHMDGQNVFGRSMPIRWSALPELIPMQGEFQGQRFLIMDPARFTPESHLDIQPGEPQIANVVARFDNEPECFGWSNQSYLSQPAWRNPAWRLPGGRFLVRLVVLSSGERCEQLFRIVNDVAQKDFRLEDPLPGDTLNLGTPYVLCHWKSVRRPQISHYIETIGTFLLKSIRQQTLDDFA